MKLLLVSAQRKEEVGGLTYEELALTEAPPYWTIPAGRAKNGREQFVPLSNLAVEIINSAKRVAGTAGLCFHDQRNDACFRLFPGQAHA